MARRVYVSGPMTGLPDLNYPAFYAEARRLAGLGLEVVNPANLPGEAACAEWSDYLRRDIAAMMACDTISMLPGWSQSKGARLERHIAVELGFEVWGAAA